MMSARSGYMTKDHQCSERVGTQKTHKMFRYIRSYINNFAIKALKEKKESEKMTKKYLSKRISVY